MPKKDMDWSKMVIYKICCKDLNITDLYIGHSCNLVQRRYKHKSTCCCEKTKNYNLKVYQFIRENGGWDNWSVIEIDKCPCLDFEEASKIERYYIEKLNATLNMIIPSRTNKEYCDTNKEIRNKKNKEWRKINKEKIKEYKRTQNKEWRNNNKEIIQQKLSEYYEKNKDIINEKRKEKITCECGSILNKTSLIQHKKSQRHIGLMEQLNNAVSS